MPTLRAIVGADEFGDVHSRMWDGMEEEGCGDGWNAMRCEQGAKGRGGLACLRKLMMWDGWMKMESVR